MKFIGRWFVLTLACAAAVWIVPGIAVVGSATTLASMLILGLMMAIINGTVKPFMKVISLPVNFLTLGLFNLVINTLMLELGIWLANGLFDAGIYCSGFGAALLASIIVSIVSSIMSSVMPD